MLKIGQKIPALLWLSLALSLLFLSYCQLWWPLSLHDGQIVELAFRERLFAPASQVLRLEIARSPEKMQQGLGRRSQLSDGVTTANGQTIDGMLFIYPGKKILSFWMKDMQFPIDICWLSDRQLMACNQNIPATPELSEEELSIYQSPLPANMVLETEPGFLSEQLFGQKLFPHF